MAKMNLKQISWTETAAIIKEEILKNFANVASFCTIGNGVLSHLSNPKPHYQLGFVFPLTDNLSGKQETIIYYPEKQAFVHLFKVIKGYPVTEETTKETKRGEMRVIALSENEFAIAFNRAIRIVE